LRFFLTGRQTAVVARKVIQTFRKRGPDDGRRAAAGGGSSVDSGSVVEKATPGSDGETDILAPREQQVLELLVKGYSYKDVSKELGISTSTVGTYVQRIYEKLHVSSRREIMERSGQNG